MAGTAHAEDHPEKMNDEQALFKQLTFRPDLAWPTVLLLVAAIVAFAVATSLYCLGMLSLGAAIFINSVASYAAFTVGHDAAHHALSSNKQVNDWCGRLSTALLSPIPFFRMFRYIHMQHHRFTNDGERDPDHYAGRGSKWLLPLRWATLDLHYFTIYLKPSVFSSRPRPERRELLLAAAFAVVVVGATVTLGWGRQYLLLFFLPTRVAITFLAFSFDFLPHYPHAVKASDDPYRATANRVGLEWLLSPLLLFQNYHLVHHLYPTVPFYRYIRVWRARERYHLAQGPALIPAFGLRPGAATSRV